MFLGQYKHSLDGKGRVVVPRKFREELDAGCVITKGQEKCLYVFTVDQWQDESESVKRLPRTDPKARRYSRSFFASAMDQTLDKQGRIQVPEPLRDYAGLEKDVMVVGVADRLELWDVAAWDNVSLEADQYYAGIEEVLSATEGI